MHMVFPVVAFFRLLLSFFLFEPKKRRLFLNRVDPLNSPQPELLDQSILFSLSLVKQVFFRASIHLWKRPVAITEPTVSSAWPLGLGSKLFPSNMQRMLNKALTRLMQSLSRVRQNGAAIGKERLYWLGTFRPEIRPPSQVGSFWAERVVMLLWCTFSFVLGYRVQESGKVTFETLKVCNNIYCDSAPILSQTTLIRTGAHNVFLFVSILF